MKASDFFKNAIKTYLEKRAKEDSLFAISYKKENKNLDECIQYILNEVYKSKCNGYTDEEIYNIAVHYYDEDDIKVDKKSANMRVVVNHSARPDKTAAKTEKSKPVRAKKQKVEPANQLSLNLFDL